MEKSRSNAETGLRWARSLVELIILQAMEDIWLVERKADSLEFFARQGFTDCADMLGMSLHERRQVLEFVRLAHKSTVSVAGASGRFKVAYRFSPQRQGCPN